MTPPVSRGFRGRRRPAEDAARLPPGQYLTTDFPVLSACPTPRTALDEWSLTIDGAVDAVARWSWDELLALPQETFTVDLHCVTRWSKLGTTWTGVPLDALLEEVAT
ncbi:MAG: molybdopterin-dependent oxidoreductase, partial [Solirubrobacterales bacterium]|nr:molybdopterin-dependent oxidoreductase [Solirubrobacterales bacterium]